MQLPTRIAITCSTALLLAACAKSETPATDTAAASAAATPAPAPAPAPAALSLAEVAGTWKMSNVPESGTDTVSTNVVLNATADTTGWTMTLPSGAKVPLHPTVAGDSVVMTSDVYSSARRKGVKTMIVSTLRMRDGKLAGTTVAHYQQTAPDSVLRLRSEATKGP